MSVQGYPTTSSVLPGQPIHFCLSSDAPGTVTFTLKRVGGGPSQALPFSVAPQPSLAAAPGLAFKWTAATPAFTVPANWPTGLYQLLEPDGSVVLAFVVLPASPGSTSTTLLHVTTLTPAAYNNAGGKSLYGFNSSPDNDEASRASVVSLDRSGGAPDYSFLIQWIEAEAIHIEYCSSVDLHVRSDLLSAYQCLIIAGHDEYWTKEMRDQTEHFVANGGNLIVLSGNTCYRQVRLENNNRDVVFYKYAAADPVADDATTTVAFAEPPVNRPQNSLLGVGWTAGAFGVGTDRAAYSVRFPQHWVFNGVGWPAGTPATSAFMTYETDAAAFVEEDEGYPRVTGEEGTPLSFVVLASADLRSWTGKAGWATMGVYHRNGVVFTAGTTDWLPQLPNDPVIQQITRNVVRRLQGRVGWDWEDVGHAIHGTALASAENKLYIATKENALSRRYPVEAEVPWRQVGDADSVTAMAGSGSTLFCITDDDQLWRRPAVDYPVPWTAIGSGPGGTKALAAAGGRLFAVDAGGALWTAVADAGQHWQRVGGVDNSIVAMTSHSDILFAATSDNRLLRSNHDWIFDSPDWVQIHNCDFAVGLATVDGALFVATSQDRLWRLDLRGLRQP